MKNKAGLGREQKAAGPGREQKVREGKADPGGGTHT
jgi:hypothetical protein